MATTYQPTQWLMPKNANQDKVGNYSFDFDGATDGISMAAPTNNNAGDISWSIWVYPTSFAAYNYFIDSGAVSINERGIFAGFEGTTGYLALNRRQSGTDKRCLTGFVDVGATINNWHHIVGVYDEDGGTAGVGQLKMYVNGVLKHTEDGSGTDLNDTTTLYIGQIYSGLPAYRFLGKISEVSIFNYPLTDGTVDPADNQIADLYGSAGAGVGNPMGLTPVPVAYYKGDKAALGAQWAVPNQVSQDYVFDFEASSLEYISLGTNSSLQPASAVTASGWIKLESLGAPAKGIVVNSESNGYNGYILWITASNNAEFSITEVAGTTWVRAISTTTFTTGIWYHVMGTWDGVNIKIYVNGILEQTTAASTIFYHANSEGYVGKYASGEFDGLISNAAIWDSDQSANITTIYNNGSPGDLTSLSPISWYKLDDSATFSTNWSIPDDGSASNTGTSVAMTQSNLVPDTVTRGTAMYSEYSFDFDGVDDYIELGSAMATSGTDWSITCWFKSSQTGGNRMLVGQTGSKYFGLNWNKLTFFSSDNTFDMVSATNQNDGNWHNVTYTYNYTSGAWKSYIDGVVDDDQVATASVDIPPWKFFGSRTTAVDFADATLNNIAYFATELSAANVTTIYNNGRPTDLTDLSPVGWWKLGEEAFSTDPAADPNGWTVPDQIGSNDGTSSGNPDLVGEAPQSFANGLSVSMDIDDRIGESGFSDNNALSYNMDSEARTTDTAP